MTRTPSGALATHFLDETTTLARVLTINRSDGVNILLTDHDADIRIPSKDTTAGSTLTFDNPVGEDGVAVKATGLLVITSSNNALDNEIVTIGVTVYRFKNTMAQAFDVKIGADRDASLLSLKRAINLDGTVGVDYFTGTTIHPDVSAASDEPLATPILISQGLGTPVGTLTSDHTGQGQSLARAFDGNTKNWYAVSAAYKRSASATEYIGKDFGGSPQRIMEAKVFAAVMQEIFRPTRISQGGWWFGSNQSPSMELELRGHVGSFPGAANGTLLGTTGVFLDTSFKSGFDIQNKTISSDNSITEYDHVWIYMKMLSSLGSINTMLMGELEFYRPSVFPDSGELALEAKVAGLAGNSIVTTETLTDGAFDDPTLVGGLDIYTNPLDTETVTIGTSVYTFVEAPFTDVAFNVLIGADALATASNLEAAIENGAGEGTLYGTGTTVSPFVTVSLATNVLTLTAIPPTHGGDAGNSIVTTETLVAGEFEFATLTGGIDALYLADPGFEASSALSSSAQAIEGLEITTIEGTAITQNDIIAGRYVEAQCSLEYVNWNETPTIVGTMILFAGVMGAITNDEDSLLQFEIMGKFSRNRTIRINTYQPNCRADLGDAQCRIPIEGLKELFEVTGVLDTSTFLTDVASKPDDYWKLGIVHWLTGNNAGIATEVASSVDTGGTFQLFLPQPLEIQVGDTGEVYPGCDKTIETCITRYTNVVNFRGEPFAPQEGALFAFKV